MRKNQFDFDKQRVLSMIGDGNSQQEVLDALIKERGQCAGLSLRSLQRFCKKENIHWKSGVRDQELVPQVQRAIDECGIAGGYRMVSGKVAEYGLHGVGEHRIRKIVKQLDPLGVETRTVRAEKMRNPIRYYADYCGYNVHVDQNSKNVDLGYELVGAVDGKSGFLFPLLVIPKKNVFEICDWYNEKIIEPFGLFDRLISDHGTEFCLIRVVHKHYWTRMNQVILTLGGKVVPADDKIHMTRSTANNRIERYWSDLNQRVNYPIKEVIRGMQDDESPPLLRLTDAVDLFSISQVSMMIASHGAEVFRGAWNHHLIQSEGGSRPVDIMERENGFIPMEAEDLLSTTDAEQLYYATVVGSKLTYPSGAGFDLLSEDESLVKRRDEQFLEWLSDCPWRFGAANSGMSCLHNHLVNGDKTYAVEVYCRHKEMTLEIAENEGLIDAKK